MEIVLIIMFVIIIILSIGLFFIDKKRKNFIQKYNIAMENQKIEAEKAQNNIEIVEKGHIQEIEKKQKEIESYKQSILMNFKETVSYGERFIIRTILELLEDINFNNYTFYHHVEYQNNNQFYQLDFLVVSPFGVMVLESKYWNGVTYLYNNSHNDIFQNTLFKNFGVGSSEKVKVFNAKFPDENEKQIVFSCYQNPVSQVREYSFNLRNQLKIPIVKNAVVFHKSEVNNILFNDKKLSIEVIDDYTKVITSDAIKEYLIGESNGKLKILSDKIIKSIESNFVYKTKIDKNNYKDKIFSYLLSE